MATCSYRAQKSLSFLRRRASLVGTRTLHDVAVGAHTCAIASLVRAEARCTTGSRTCLQGLLCGTVSLFFGFTTEETRGPGHEASLLQSLAEGEGHVPWRVLEHRVHGGEVDSGALFIVFVEAGLAREEEDTGHSGGHGAAESRDSEGGDFLGGGNGALESVLDHVRLKDGALEINVCPLECSELSGEDLLGDSGARVHVVVAVGHNLRLNDGAKTGTLADSGVASKVCGGFLDGKSGRQALGRVNLQNIAPPTNSRKGSKFRTRKPHRL